jgi:hypothetical protein
MKVWREKLKEQLDIMASFPSDIKKYINFLERDPTDHTSEDVINKIIIEFTPKLKELSLEQRQQVMTGIEKYVNKVFIVDKYANDPKYINNSKQLIADAF